MSRSRIDAVCYVCLFFFMRLLFKCLCSQTVFTGGVMGLQCQLNLMSCLILMLVHFDKTPSWQKKTHSLRSNPVFLLLFFLLLMCLSVFILTAHCDTERPPPKRSLPLLHPRRLQSGRDHFDRRRPRRPIFLSCYEEKPFRGSKRETSLAAISQTKSTFGGRICKPAHKRTPTRAHTHSEELATR